MVFSQKGTHEYIVLYFAHNRFEKSSLENAFTFILLGMNGTQKHCHHELKESIFETIIAKIRKAFVFSLLVIISFKLKTPYLFQGKKKRSKPTISQKKQLIHKLLFSAATCGGKGSKKQKKMASFLGDGTHKLTVSRFLPVSLIAVEKAQHSKWRPTLSLRRLHAW